jgi:dipeptidyl aminopeptidase/acylaminoacyl peptidase
MEKPVVFQCRGQQLVGMLHVPEGRERVPAVLLLHGFTGTHIEPHRMFVKLARQLAAVDIASLRFDYRGHGDSAGDFEEFSLQSAVADAVEAVRFLARQKRVAPRRLGVVGLSLGAAITAGLVAREIRDWKALALLAPVAEGAGILDALSTPDAVGSLTTTGVTDYHGNTVGMRFVRQFAEMKPTREILRARCPVLLLHGSQDETVPADHTDLYEKALRGARRQVRKIIIDGADHTFNGHRWEKELLDQTVEWLRQHL